MSSYLPPTEDGYLPLAVWLAGVVSLGNVIQSYMSVTYSQRIYSRTPVTPLSARTFGTWTMAVGIVRMFAAYHMNESSWYQLSICTYAIAFFHFGTEAFVYKTCKPSGPWLAPAIVASTNLVWHLLQYENYVN